jgi:hypothetical protein
MPKPLALSVLLCVLAAACTDHSAETRQREAVHQLDEVLTLRQKSIELGAPWLNTDPAYIPQDVLRQLKSNDEEMLRIGKTISADALAASTR